MEIVIFDMAKLEYSRDGDLMAVRAPQVGELLRITLPTGCSDREGVFMLLDRVLRDLLLPSSDGHWARTGLYNPISRHVAVLEVPATRPFGDGSPLNIDSFGSAATLDEESGSLRVGLRELPAVTLDAAGTRAVLAAH